MAGKPFRGMVVEVSLDPVVGHEQGRSRPCVVIQNDVGNRFASTTIIVPLTDAAHILAPSPIYVRIKKGDGGTTKDSYASMRPDSHRRSAQIHQVFWHSLS
jgi:mRNA interferase MazF